MLVAGLAGCTQSKPGNNGGNGAPGGLKIVAQVQIDENGQTVPTTQAAQPVDPAGNGKATCGPGALAMAGALTGPDSALGINIRDGAQLAIDKHNQANPGCQVQLIPFDTGGV